MALILWTTKDQTLISISSLGVNRLFYVAGSSYPTRKSSQNINSTISTWFSFRDWTEIQGQNQLVQTFLFPSILSIPKTSKAPTRHQVLFSKQNIFHTQFKIPRNIMHELPHNHSKNPKHTHPLPCVGPYRNTCNNSKPFPDILSTAKVFSSKNFSFSLLDQVLLLLIYNTPKSKSKSNHTFLVLLKSLTT
jgi:hypothetical protein